MTYIISLGARRATWWVAQNAIGRLVLNRAIELCGEDKEAADAIFSGGVHQLLDFERLAPGLRERVWDAVEEAARQIAADPPDKWGTPVPEHVAVEAVAELAREMEAFRSEPDRPGIWAKDWKAEDEE